jgi:hypothetical protein
LTISTRAATGFLLLVAAGAAGVRVIDSGDAVWIALKIVTASLAVMFVPGAMLTLLWRPRLQIALIETAAFGAGLSLVVVQLLTIAAVSLHFSIDLALGILAGSVAVAAVAALRSRGAATLTITFDDAVVAGLATALAGWLYWIGSPVAGVEDQIHAAIVRRLTALPAPALDNLYLTPGVVYTYPFPGTHYLMALIARAADVDALFVYHKLRFLWGPVAVLMLCVAARHLFGSVAVGTAVGVAAVALISNGVFAYVPGFSSGWAQLIPFSHASDVAMTVLLPALLVMAFGYVVAETRRGRGYFLAGSIGLVLMLTVVHIREMAQFAVYVGCFLVATLAIDGLRQYRVRAAVLLATTVGIVLAFSAWQASVAPFVDATVVQRRTDLLTIAREIPLSSLLLAPASQVIENYVPEFRQLWGSQVPFFLLAGIGVVCLLARAPLVALMAGSTAAYLAVMTIPLLAIPYIYATYFEILYTPVRNIVFFVYLLAGAALYALTVHLTTVNRSNIILPLAGFAAGGLAARIHAVTRDVSSDVVVPLVVLYLAGLFIAIAAASRPAVATFATRLEARLQQPFQRFAIGFVSVLVPFALLTSQPDQSPLHYAANEPTFPTPETLRARFDCVNAREADIPFREELAAVYGTELPDAAMCAPPDAVTRWLAANVPASAVVAVDMWNPHLLPLFAPQQIVAVARPIPGNQKALFPQYYRLYDERLGAASVQPFFNAVETRDERMVFLTDLKVTHVLVDPAFHDLLAPVLDSLPADYLLRYRQDGWAVYEVIARLPHVRPNV